MPADLEQLAQTKGQPLFLRFNGAIDYRLNQLCTGGLTRQAIALAGLEAEITRMENRVANVSTAEARALADCRRLLPGSDPAKLLRNAVKAQLSKSD